MCQARFGTCVEAFRAFDKRGLKRMKKRDFVAACAEVGIDFGAFLFDGLNYQDRPAGITKEANESMN